jgi:tagatose-6-phosphate ketose/aldose isomerase
MKATEWEEYLDPLTALLNLSPAEKGRRGLEHTPSEIAQQPATWTATFDRLAHQLPQVREFLTRAGVNAPAEQRPTVFLVGAGTSDYIGRTLHHLLRQQWQCEVIPVASTSLLPNFNDYLVAEGRYLWISFSRSGDSPEGVAVLERSLAELPHTAHLLVTCNGYGKMNRAIQGCSNALAVVLDPATNDRGLAMTSSFTNMVLAGQILAHAWTIDEYTPILHSLVDSALTLLPRAAQLASDLAAQGLRKACFVGTGALAGTAMESALKLLELTAGRVLALTQPTLALRHGPMAALDSETLFVSLISTQEQRRRCEVDLLREIGAKRLARTRVAVALSDTGLRGDADHVLAPETSASIPDLCRPVLDVLFGQLLGLFASIEAGLKPDTPSPSGAISRVVPDIGIY